MPTHKLRRLRLAILGLLLTFFVIPLLLTLGCSHPIPPAPPRITCPLPPRPVVPVLSPGLDGSLITLTQTEATELGTYIREERAWDDLAATCLEAQP